MQFEDKRKYFLLACDSKNDTLLSKFDHLSELKVFRNILRESTNDLTWIHNEYTRKAICKSILTKYEVVKGIATTKYMSEISFKKHLSSLVKKSLLIKRSRGMYQINENYLK